MRHRRTGLDKEWLEGKFLKLNFHEKKCVHCFRLKKSLSEKKITLVKSIKRE